jgi:hypothetical protein
LKIYDLVLPVDAFYSRRYPSADAAALLLTCKLINREAYPVFLSRNNFDVVISACYYHTTHDFFKHVRQVSLEWSPKIRFRQETPALKAALGVGKENFEMLKYLYKFPKLQIIHIASFWSRDQGYLDLEDHCKEDGAAQTYLEHSGLIAFLEIPGLTKITFSYNALARIGKSEGMIVLDKYMAKHLGCYQPGSWNS